MEEENALPFVAFKARHLNEEIEGIELYEEIYGKEKVRTLHVLLVLCLNLTVDPPDLLAKVSPCAKMEAWFDPKEKNLARALEVMGKNLQNQYERWQPKARYRQSLDPTIEEVHRLCQSLRRSARDERFLFHYNGHGVPRPTENGEIWVFNKNFTKYIPLSLYDLQGWMGGPSVYVFDCNNAGRIIRMMESFCNKRQNGNNTTPTPYIFPMDTNIILAACHENEDIPLNPEIPADLFTSCLTTPIKMALHWYLLRNKVLFPDYLQDSMLDLINGSPSNRVSMFGEINWVFTAVTDTIAWSCLPTPLFQRLFRQDLLVASLFRNFLLAERIMHYYGVRPQSYPVLPHTYNHPMWDAWDHALDGYMTQLPEIKRRKQLAVNNDNEENLPIIRHPTDDPPFISQINLYNNDSTDDDDDDIEEDEDSINPRTNNDPLMPRSIMMTHDFTDNRPNKTERFFNDNHVHGAVLDNTVARNEDEISRMANMDNKIALPAYLNTKTPITSNIRPTRSNSQSGKTVANVVKPSNVNPLNGSSSDYVQFRHTEFFNDHMTAFEIWLKTADEKKPVPVQLPILLQVLLSQVHRHRALRLISEYMDLGKWAVVQCLTVGIFPYIIRLLQSPVCDVKPFLVFIWGKIISSAQTDFAKNDVVKDAGYKYFVSCLTETESYEIIVRTIAVFALAKMLNNNPAGQKLYIKQNITTTLISELENNPPDLNNENYIRLRLWFILCFAKLWSENDEAKWYGVRQKINEKLFLYLKDINPEVRAATIYALGTFLNNKADDGIRSKHSVQVEQNVCQHLLKQSLHDSSPLVRAELVVAMKYMVNLFSNQVVSMAIYYDDWMFRNSVAESIKCAMPSSPTIGRNLRSRQGSIPGSMSTLASADITHDGRTAALRKQPSNIVLSSDISIRQKAVSNGDIANEFHVLKWPRRESLSPNNADIFWTAQYTTQRSGQKPLINELQSQLTYERRVPSVSNFLPYNSVFPISNIYAQMWDALIKLSKDPHYKVSTLANRIVSIVRNYTRDQPATNEILYASKDVILEPPGSPKFSRSPIQFRGSQVVKHSALYPTHKHKVDLISGLTSSDSSADNSVFSNEENIQFDFSDVTTDFFNWSSKYFTQPLLPHHKLSSKMTTTSDSVKTSHSEYNELIMSKSRSFDKVSYRNLPNLGVIDQRTKNSTRRLMHIIETAMFEDRTNRMMKQKLERDEGASDWTSANHSPSGPQLSQVFLQKMQSRPELMKFHPYLNYLAVADNSGVSLWNWQAGYRAQYMLTQSVKCRSDMDCCDQNGAGFITSLEFINYEEERGGLLAVGTMDGKIKVWRNYLRDMGQDPDIVTAWQALIDPLGCDRQAGLVTHWAQMMGQMTLSGDVRYVRLWDSNHECKISDMPTNCDSCVTCLDRTQDGRLVVAGFGNGHIKMFDVRVSVNDCVINAGTGDSGWIHKVAFSESSSQVFSVGTHAQMDTWSMKQWKQSKSYRTFGRRTNASKEEIKVRDRDGIMKGQYKGDLRISLTKAQSHLLKSCEIVHCADLRVSSDNTNEHLAIIGYGKESRGILTTNASSGVVNSTFKFYEGFSRANIETPTSVCVHPYQSLVGAGLSDCNILLLKLQSK